MKLAVGGARGVKPVLVLRLSSMTKHSMGEPQRGAAASPGTIAT